jgi:membrane protease subunit HflK
MNKFWEVLQWALKILPRFVTIAPDEAAVVVRLGKAVRVVPEGGHYIFTWPVIEEVDVLTTTRQVVDVPTQDVLTKDRVPVCMNVSVEYIISDPYKAIYGVEDFDECLQELTGDAARHVINRATFDWCLGYMADIKLSIFENIEKEAEIYGVEVLEVHVPTFTRGHTIRLIQQ